MGNDRMESRLSVLLRAFKIGQQNNSAFDILCKFTTDQYIVIIKWLIVLLFISFVHSSIYLFRSFTCSLVNQSFIRPVSHSFVLSFSGLVILLFFFSVILFADQRQVHVCWSTVVLRWRGSGRTTVLRCRSHSGCDELVERQRRDAEPPVERKHPIDLRRNSSWTDEVLEAGSR